MDYPDYQPSAPLRPLSQAELDALDQVLARLPADGAMTLDGVDGYLTGLLVSPARPLHQRRTAEWLPVVWGGDLAEAPGEAAPFPSRRQRKDTVVLLLRHLGHLAQQLAEAPEDWEPIFSVAEQGLDEWVDARDWCAGFLAAADLDPEAWAPLWRDEDLGPLLLPLRRLGGGVPGLDDSLEEDRDLTAVDQDSRAVPDLVLMLQARSAGA